MKIIQKENKKTCITCQKSISYSKFSWKNKKNNIKSGKCKNCTNTYTREHYKNNKEYYKKKAKRHSKRYKQIGRDLIYGFKLSNPCFTCGESNPIVLEFDHIDPKTKRHDVSHMATHGFSTKSIEEEIEKCVILCANCHREKTAKQQNWHSYKTKQKEKKWEEQ